MIKAALEYVVGLKKPETVRHGGGVYADKPLYQMKKADFPTLKLNTLESIVRYVQKIGDERQSEDYEAAEPIIIHIESATCVALKDIANVGDGKRDCMVLATAEVPKFQYGEFHDAESFNIALQSKFLDTEDKATILQVVGNLKEDAVRTMTDDGVSQVTAVRTGVATAAHGSWRQRRTFTTIWRSSWKKILTAAKWFCLFEKRRSWKNEQSDFNGAADEKP